MGVIFTHTSIISDKYPLYSALQASERLSIICYSYYLITNSSAKYVEQNVCGGVLLGDKQQKQ